MFERARGDVTVLLDRLRAGNRDSLGPLMELIYPEMRVLARRQMRHERRDPMLQPTLLVNEAYLRLVAHDRHNWENRAHFFGAASRVMRRILVDHARARKTQKRDGDHVAVEDAARLPDRSVDLLVLDQALEHLEKLSPRQAMVVQMRYFGGLTVPQIAECLGVTTRTVDRDWAVARAWLRIRLS